MQLYQLGCQLQPSNPIQQQHAALRVCSAVQAGISLQRGRFCTRSLANYMIEINFRTFSRLLIKNSSTRNCRRIRARTQVRRSLDIPSMSCPCITMRYWMRNTNASSMNATITCITIYTTDRPPHSSAQLINDTSINYISQLSVNEMKITENIWQYQSHEAWKLLTKKIISTGM